MTLLCSPLLELHIKLPNLIVFIIFSLFYLLYQVIERLANNLGVAGRQRSHVIGRSSRMRSFLELHYLVNPSDLNCIMHLARFYMLYSMDLSDLMPTIVKIQDVSK